MVKRKKSLGHAFTDEVARVTGKSVIYGKIAADDWKDALLPSFNYSANEVPKTYWLQTFFFIITLGIFFVIFMRLFHLQILWGKQNRDLADGNRIQIKVIHAPRGVIFDRNGQVLAANAPAFRLLDKKNEQVPSSGSNTPRIITREEALELEVQKSAQDLNLEVDNVRTYPMGEKMAHLIGYVGEISPEQLKNTKYSGYRLGDWVGQSGVEAQYEKSLKGIDGGEIIEVDSQGKKVRSLRVNPPIPGHNVYLNINAGLQQKLYEELKSTLTKLGKCCGAAIAENPQNGQILALVSFPTFDPNVFTKHIDDNVISEIFSRADSPVLNRAIAGTYPPGSTFKIVTSIAALGSSKVTPQSEILDNGIMHLGSFSFANWYFSEYGKTEGLVNLVKALKRSNDIYFYQVGQMMGEQTLIDWSRKMNMGKVLGIDLPGEIPGLIPDNNWKQKTFGEVWYPGDTLHMAIGQGFVLATPLQILGITSLVASNGTLYKPQLINKITVNDTVLSQFKPQTLISNLVNPKDLEVVREGLEEVPKTGGTAWPFFTFPIKTAGKTGTAEFGDPKGRTHAWYTSYAPAQNPKIALTVLVEASGEGSNVAAPVAKEAYRYFFSPDENRLIQDVYQIATASARQFGE